MPELPEVETVRRVLQPQIQNYKIEEIIVLCPDVIKHPSAEAFCRALRGATVTEMTRRGKFLRLHLDSNATLVLHLRMTGQLVVTPESFPREKHTHVVFKLSSGQELRYIDVRRFGGFWLLDDEESASFPGMKKLGLEPFDPLLTAEYLSARAGKSRRAIKDMLLDQAFIAGIGNIYADEILFYTGIHPQRMCREISRQEWTLLAEAIPYIMQWGIDTNSVTAEEYLRGMGKEYRNTPDLRVYGRAGNPCSNCGALLLKVRIGGRGSCYCPACQK